MNTHLYLVSEQPTPNITPALDQSTRPEQVILLVSQGMEQRAVWLESVLTQAGIKVSHWPVQHPWDVEHVQGEVLKLLDEYEGQALVLNATGGTKPMSIAAYEAFRAFDYPIFYVHPERDQLIWMYPDGRGRHQLADRVKIPQFLQAHGWRVESTGDHSVLPVHYQLGESLIARIDYYSSALGLLNWYAQSASNHRLSSVLMKPEHERQSAFQDLLEQLTSAGVLSVREGRLVFSSADTRFFANGGWLEQYVFRQVNSLKKRIPQIQHSAQSVVVRQQEKAVMNELDVAFLADNKLHLIECKAKNFRKAHDQSGAEAIYKLDSLTSILGGLRAKAMLVSYRPMRPADLERAQHLKLSVIQAGQLQQLNHHLQQWIQQGLR